eukprot:9956570-Alexandrium_andersonii.AAC.1
MSASLVGSEMCIRDRNCWLHVATHGAQLGPARMAQAARPPDNNSEAAWCACSPAAARAATSRSDWPNRQAESRRPR